MVKGRKREGNERKAQMLGACGGVKRFLSATRCLVHTNATTAASWFVENFPLHATLRNRGTLISAIPSTAYANWITRDARMRDVSVSYRRHGATRTKCRLDQNNSLVRIPTPKLCFHISRITGALRPAMPEERRRWLSC